MWCLAVNVAHRKCRVLKIALDEAQSVMTKYALDVPKRHAKVLLHSFVQTFEGKRVGDYGLVYEYLILILHVNITYRVLGVD